MDKLQYDSYYKFIVSIGILLIAAPILLLYLWFSGIFDLMITQQEFEGLTTIAAELFTKKMKYMSKVCSALPCLFFISELLGVSLFIWGCRKWYFIQKMYLDKMHESDVKEKDILLRKMTLDEKIGSLSEEVREEANLQNPKKESTDDVVVRYLGLEQLCCKNLEKGIGSDFIIQQNVKIRDFEYDIVACSKKDDVDLIYEIKYWETVVSESLFDRTCERIVSRGIVYENYTHRKKQNILYIVSNSESIMCMKKKGIEKTGKEKYQIKVEFVDKTSLLPN